jgi:hypothetical protein
MARWARQRWPAELSHARLDPETLQRIEAAIPLLGTRAERAAWAKRPRPPTKRWLGSSSAVSLIDRIAAMPGDDFTREVVHDAIDAPYLLAPSRGGPSRTRARFDAGPVVFRRGPFERRRPDLAEELLRPPVRIRRASIEEGRALIDLACEAMITRSRDLEAFVHGDPRDVHLVDDGQGLVFAWNGMVPERRLMFRAAYGVLTLMNGVPIGYVQADALMHSAEIAFNTFPTFRGGEAARVFARLLAATQALLGAGGFSIEPYQLGDDNDEAIESGAWWFYFKLGFRPRDRAVAALARRELARMAKDPRHKSSPAVLRRLARRHLYWRFDPRAQPVEAELLRAVERGRAADPGAIAARIGLGTRRPPALEDWLVRWAPMLAAIPGWSGWRSRQAIGAILEAKAGRSELEYVRRFDAHPELGPALAALAMSPGQSQRI